jgi:putative nucleotidyltransferase with HDIG domain
VDEASERVAAADRAARTLRAHVWPDRLLRVLERVAGDQGRAYLVGGTVRDVLLGRGGDARFDVATDRLPEQVMAAFERVEPVGLAHGTVLVIEDHVPSGDQVPSGDGLQLEVTTFRREGEYRDARHPDHVSFTHEVLEDLARRDLTVNAIAFDPISGTFHDPHGGARDLERRVLRAVGDPLARFREDALRPLRVARLAATLEMEPEPETRKAMSGVADRATLVAMERVREEWTRMLSARHPSEGIELLREAGLLELWAPEIAHTWGVTQNRWHAFDVYDHTLRAVDEAPADKPRVRWAALLHDIGKPVTRAGPEGAATFYGHAEVGARMADVLLRRFRFPNVEREAIVHLVREHMFEYRPEWSDAAVRRWLRKVGVEAVADLFDLRIADALASGVHSGFPVGLEAFRVRIERVLAASSARSIRDLLVDGEDVMRVLGVGPGPRVGEVLRELFDEVLEEPERNRREHLLERIGAWRAPRSSEA